MPLRGWLDKKQEERRRRDMAANPRLEWDPDACDRLRDDGYGAHWRIHDGLAHGHRLDGTRATIPAERFIERYLRPYSA